MSKNRTSQTPPHPSISSSLVARWLPPALIIALFLPAIFLLPYHVPMIGPSGSQSWEFGFNNTTAQEFIALLLLTLFGWRLFSLRSDFRQAPVARVIMKEGGSESMRSLWLAMGAFQIFNSAILIIWYNILPYTHYGEITYFIQRLEIMVATGRLPYRDFEFSYGAEMLVVPMFVYHLFRAHLSVETAYFFVLLLHFAFGYALLAYIVSRLNIQRGRVLLFVLIAIPLVNLTMGMQWNPLRFMIAPASMFAIHHAYLSTADSPLRRWILLVFAALLVPLINFLVSPELGLALMLALFVYFGWFILGPERRFALLTLPVLAGVALAFLVFPRAYFNSMLNFGKGGLSLPMFPTIHILAFLASAIWVFPQLGVIAIRDKTSAAPFSAGLAILMGLFILPAMGRCDPGHIYSNSLCLLLIALAAVTWLAPKWRYSLLGAFTLVFVALFMVSLWDNYKDPIQGALQARSQLSHIDYKPDNYAGLASGEAVPRVHYSKLLPMSDWLKQLPNVKIGIPLAVDEATERYLLLTGRVVPQYHIEPYSGIYGSEDLERKYNDMRSMEYILVPRSYVGYLQPANLQARMRMQGEADCRFLSGLLLFPVNLTAIHPLFDSNSEIMHRIALDYEVVNAFPDTQHPEMLLLKRKAH